MAEREIYRVEIPIIVDDQTDTPLKQAERKISKFAKSAQKETERIRKHFQHIAKYQIEPVMKVRDQLTTNVLKADKLIRKLDVAQASPLIAAQDRVSAVVTRINAMLDALDKGKVDVVAEMRGPLLDEIIKAKKSLSELNNVKAGPIAELRGQLFGQLTKAMSQIKGLDLTRAEPQATLRERVTWKVRKISSSLRDLTSRTWNVTLEAKDKVSGVLRGVTGGVRRAASLLTSPLTLLGVGGGIGGLTKLGIDMVIERENITTAFETLLGSAEAAEKRIEELTEFAGQTPFMRDEIYEASRILEVFTRGALSTSKGLKLVGDVAAGTGQDYKDVALWIGRLYDAMASGRPVGEMTSRLQEMGAISGEQRALLEDLAKSGKDISQTWPQAEKVFSRFEGQMERMSTGLGNLLTSVKSFFRETVLLRWGKGIEKELRPLLERFRQWRRENPEQVQAIGDAVERIVSASMNRVVNFFKRGYALISDIINDESLTWDQKITMSLERMFNAASAWMKGPGGEKIREGIQTIGGIMATAIEGLAPVIVPPAVNLGVEIAKGIIAGFWEAIKTNPIVMAILGGIGGAKIGGMIGGLPGLAIGFFGGAALSGVTALIQRAVSKKHQHGGILTRPHVGLVAEAGPEAIIPLSARMRSRALSLYEETGRWLGVRSYAEGGFAGSIPAAAPAVAGLSTSSPRESISVTNYISVSVGGSNADPDEIAEAIAIKLQRVYNNMI